MSTDQRIQLEPQTYLEFYLMLCKHTQVNCKGSVLWKLRGKNRFTEYASDV